MVDAQETDSNDQQELNLIEALKEKYCAGTEGLTEMFVFSVRSSKVPVSLVGAQQIAIKQAQLSHLRDASVAGTATSKAGPDGALATEAPNIQQLDISRCRFTGFSELVAIASQLPRLTILDVSGNALGDTGTAALAAAAPNLRVLVMNNTGIAWSDVVAAAATLPRLQELHVGYNKISALKPAAVLPQLQLLDVSGNDLAKWEDLNDISAWPSLQRLLLAENPLTNVEYSGGFAALSSLVLSRTQIADWKSMDALDHFPALSDLKIKPTPLTEAHSPSDARLITIARIAGLKFLNGGKVDQFERDNAERFYARFVASDTAEHPRYKYLCSRHGISTAPVAAADTGAPATMANDMVEVTLVSMISTRTTVEQVHKKVPRTLDVGRLRMLVQRQFRTGTLRLGLSIRYHKGDIPVPLDDDMRDLSFYGVYDGAEILTQEM